MPIHQLGTVWIALFGTLGGCAPPDPVAGVQGAPSIEILFPESGQEIPLNDDCELDTIIVVDIDGLDLQDPEGMLPPEDGQGHWHGGPNLDIGYCRSDSAWCDNYLSPKILEKTNLNLGVVLASNDHQEIGDRVLIEITAVPPKGVTCP